jgi:PBP1b-binding outer membrane lipoprotein LpoB
MKRLIYPILLLCALLMTGCEDYETYADMKEKEQDAIERFISEQNIWVIDESTFYAQGQTTDVSKNQFVRFDRNGVYMQIIRKGCGDKLEENKNVTLLCRFMEQNLLTNEILVRNDKPAYLSTSSSGTIDVSIYLDKMNVTRTGTTITASFTQGMMYQYHGSTTVPAGWLVPLNYVNVGYPQNDGDEISKVRLIVPHSQGTADASSSVVPCYYEITYQRTL